MLTYILSYYLAVIPYLSTLSNYGLSWYIAVGFHVRLSAANQNRVLHHPRCEHRVCIVSVVGRHKSWWNNVPLMVRAQKVIRAMLLINRTAMLIVAGNALGFFTLSGNLIPFPVDLSDFCRSFREERNTRIKIYISHHVLLVNEVYNVIKRNTSFDIRTTIWYKIIFRRQNRMNGKLCRIIRRERVEVLLKNFTSGWVRW